MTATHLEFGERGERCAEAFLRARGLKLVERRFRTAAGELDLIMLAGATVVFVEVKTRRDRRLADPQDSVTAQKRRKLATAAQWFLRAKHWEDRALRFDVVAVTLPEQGEPQIDYFPDAFPL